METFGICASYLNKWSLFYPYTLYLVSVHQMAPPLIMVADI